MSSILYGLAVLPLAATALWLIYDRRYSPRGIKRREALREYDKQGAAARLDLFNRTPD